LSLKKMTWNCI